jgi:hypothetical protein
VSFDLSAVNPTRPTEVAWRRAPGVPPVAAQRPGDPESRAAILDAVPASPPPEVREQILAAQRAVQDMHERGRELHFDMTGGRVRIELRDLDGNVLRTIPGSEALEIASGEVVE